MVGCHGAFAAALNHKIAWNWQTMAEISGTWHLDLFNMFNFHLGLSENGVYSQWNSHLIGIMISKTIGFRGTNLFSDTSTESPAAPASLVHLSMRALYLGSSKLRTGGVSRSSRVNVAVMADMANMANMAKRCQTTRETDIKASESCWDHANLLFWSFWGVHGSTMEYCSLISLWLAQQHHQAPSICHPIPPGVQAKHIRSARHN